MPDLWLLLALQAITLVGGALAGALALAIGGAGGLSVLKKRLDVQDAKVERIDERITHEVKSRAGLKAVQKRTDADVAAEALQRLAGDTPDVPRPSHVRPSVIGR